MPYVIGPPRFADDTPLRQVQIPKYPAGEPSLNDREQNRLFLQKLLQAHVQPNKVPYFPIDYASQPGAWYKD